MTEQSYINPSQKLTYHELEKDLSELDRDRGRFAKAQGGQVPTNPLDIPKQPPTSFSNQTAILPDEPPIDASDCGDTYGVDLTKVNP